MERQRQLFANRLKKPVRIEVRSGKLAAREALSKLMSALRPLKLDPEASGKVELVMAEVLNNVVEHAYPEGEPEGPITVTCSLDEDALLFLVTDQGLGMPGGETPKSEEIRVDVDLMQLPEGGFGWVLIRDLATDVEYRRAGWENQLSLRVSIIDPASDDANTP